METVLAVRCWAIYAHWNLLTLDSKDLIIFGDQALAREVCKEMRKEIKTFGRGLDVNGLKAGFAVREVLLENPSVMTGEVGEILQSIAIDWGIEDYKPKTR